MKAKLIKKKDSWYNLYQDNIGIGSTHSELQGYKLSIKNCQAIERGYDLDELAKIEYPICEVWNDEEAIIRKLAFKKGFQKALELLGDKIFTLDDIYTVFIMGREGMEDKMNRYVTRIHEPTEWDVEIEMFIADDLKSVSKEWYKLGEPKLDENGCIILKRI
jgi:hypothetical protein